jgi:hypothetical protein
MDIILKCPECKDRATIELTDDEAQRIKQRILDEGRSPTLIVRCVNNHELLVTLYNLRSGEGLGVRDIVVALRGKEGSEKQKKSGDKEVDWLAKAFGGED